MQKKMKLTKLKAKKKINTFAHSSSQNDIRAKLSIRPRGQFTLWTLKAAILHNTHGDNRNGTHIRNESSDLNDSEE